MQQFVVTPAAGKRLIARAIAVHPAVRRALQGGRIVVVAGSTNGYVAAELLAAIGQSAGFSPAGFFRGLTLPPGQEATIADRGRSFAGDVVIDKGQWLQGSSIFDVLDDLQEDDVILKGANALHLARRQAAVLVGHPAGGTVAAALSAVVGRRVRLILPVGLEKRVSDDLCELACLLNAPGAAGPRLLPVPGEVFSEIEALQQLCGVQARLVAGGGVCGAEGAVWLAVSGESAQEEAAALIMEELAAEPPFSL